MSLEQFRSQRLVALAPEVSAHDAARAMADNHIGAVLVVAKRRLVGMVTDRDLALAIVGRSRIARRVRLEQVMSRDVATLEIHRTADEAAEVMKDNGCRRVPLTENGEVVGMVTLDDLIVHGLIDAAAEREVIQAQLEAPSRLKPRGSLRPRAHAGDERVARERAARRHEARAERAYRHILAVVERYTGLGSTERAERALIIVVGAICRRLTKPQAEHLVAQLPSKLQPALAAALRGPDKKVTIESIEAALRDELDGAVGNSDDLVQAVCDALSQSISEGEIDAVREHLPARMKSLFPAAPRVDQERAW